MVRHIALGMIAAAAPIAAASAQVTVFTGGSTYSETFDSMATTGTTPSGWTTSTGTLLVGAGTSTTGGTYSFGAAGAADRALGSLNTNAVIPVITASFTNGGGGTITALTIAYDAEVWRFGGSASRAGAIDRLDFAYSLNGGAFTDLDALDAPGFDYVAAGVITAGALDGNAVFTSRGATLSGLSIASGQSFSLRWTDFNVAGSDDGIGIDNFGLTGTFATAIVPEPASWVMMTGGFGLLGAALRRRRTTVAFG